MSSKKRFVFLSAEFYADYPITKYPEIEQKPFRPYIQVIAVIDNITFAIPLRSNINHPHVLWTDKTNRCGLDFSKAIVVTDEKYIDNTRNPHIRQNEFDALRGKDYRIKQRMIQYINDYKDAKSSTGDKVKKSLIEKSTLKYFEDVLFGEE